MFNSTRHIANNDHSWAVSCNRPTHTHALTSSKTGFYTPHQSVTILRCVRPVCVCDHAPYRKTRVARTISALLRHTNTLRTNGRECIVLVSGKQLNPELRERSKNHAPAEDSIKRTPLKHAIFRERSQKVRLIARDERIFFQRPGSHLGYIIVFFSIGSLLPSLRRGWLFTYDISLQTRWRHLRVFTCALCGCVCVCERVSNAYATFTVEETCLLCWCEAFRKQEKDCLRVEKTTQGSSVNNLRL